MKKRIIYILVGLLITPLCLVACGDSSPTPAVNSTPSSGQAATTLAAVSPTPAVSTTQPGATTTAATSITPATGALPTTTGVSQYPMTIKDDSGTAITIAKKPERIVCLQRDCIDDLAELNIEPVAIHKDLVLFSTNPLIFGEKAKSFPTIGGTSFFEPNLEDITKAKPDLIMGISGVHDGLREALKNVAPIYNAFPKNYLTALDNLKTIGRMVSKPAEAEASATKFMTRLATYKAKVPGSRVVMFGVATDSNSFLISTEKTLVCNLLAEIAKCPWKLPDNAGQYAAFGLASYSTERVLAFNPDAIFSLNQNGVKSLEDLKKDSQIWKEVKAVKNNQFFTGDGEIWDNNGGIRSITVILDEAATKLYPDVFPKSLP